ncbi:MAG: hypothetical protein JJT77_07985 [Crocinitomicaceae bacterium]|nr:hypothetical protein [Crocinitomicaceae bacterium]
MIEQQIQMAKRKLAEHSAKGMASELSIFEVAQLMDRIHGLSDDQKILKNNDIFFNPIVLN